MGDFRGGGSGNPLGVSQVPPPPPPRLLYTAKQSKVAFNKLANGS